MFPHWNSRAVSYPQLGPERTCTRRRRSRATRERACCQWRQGAQAPASATPSITTRGTEAAAGEVWSSSPMQCHVGWPLAACRGRRRQAGRQAAQADASNSRGEHAGKGRHEDGHELQLHPVRMAPHGARTVFKGHGVHRPLLHLGHSLLHPERSPGAQSPPHGIAKCQSVREKPSPQDPSGKSPVADGVCCLNTTEDRLSLPLPAVLAQSSGSVVSDPAA